MARLAPILALAALPCVPLPGTALAGPPALTCTAQAMCVVGDDCVFSDATVSLQPLGENYRVFLDAGQELLLKPIAPSSNGAKSYVVALAGGVAVLLSVYADGRFALTVQQELDGPHVETTFGRCVPGA